MAAQRARVSRPEPPRSASALTRNPYWFALRCPAGCAAYEVQGPSEAARLARDHPAACPDPGPAVQPLPGGAAIRPFVYADRIRR